MALKIPLAETYNPADRSKVNGWVYSEKYDGCRAYYVCAEKALYSRSGFNFNMPKEFMKDFPKDSDLDGEIFSVRGDFSKLAGILNTKDKSDLDLSGIKYMVFDRPGIEGTFIERMPSGISFVSKNIVPVTYKFITPKTNLEEILKNIEKEGGEGLILRNPEAEYERKRSKNLLKYVSSHTAEAVVFDRNIGKGRNSERMGSLAVKTNINGVEMSFNLSGFSDEQRENADDLFPDGCIVTFKYREITKTGKPRFPIFVRIRDEL